MLTEFVPFSGILFKIIKFGIDVEELILCESYCIVWNREYMVSDVWIDFW